jgi:peptidoglycan/xylan/chitin deacetylase (PgdA/CDA1 family)
MGPAALMSRASKAIQVRLARNVKLRARPSRLTEPVVSFTFDDFPRSALTEGGRMLRQAGWTGTYFAAGGFCGRVVDEVSYFSREDLVQADAEGHEIACHTFGHLRLAGEDRPTILADLQRNADFIHEALPDVRLSSFAYPYGDLDLGKKALMAARFPVCRGIWPGLNAGRLDLAQLKAVALERRSLDRLDIDAWLDGAQSAKAWLVFFTHDISDDPSPYGCDRRTFAEVVERVAARGIKVLPLKDAAGLARLSA